MKRNIIYSIIISILIIASCGDKQGHTEPSKANDPLSMAILYNYYSSEYKALAYQAFNGGKAYLSFIASNNKPSEMAVVVDIDETVLDNSPYQAKAIVDGFSYPEKWNEWCNLAEAKPVPGSLEFLNFADSLGFRIFYISNRKKDFVLKSTIKNLLNEGFPQVSMETVMLREQESEDNPNPSDKESRRKVVRNLGLEIILLAGDNLGDFFTDNDNLSTRDSLVLSNKLHFGNRYLVLPNPMYGNWPAAIGLNASPDSILARLREMSF